MMFTTKRKSTFARIYLIALAVAIAALVLNTGLLLLQLKSYERNRPEARAKNVYRTYFANATPDSLTTLLAPATSTEDAKATMKQALTDAMGTATPEMYKASSGIGGSYEKYMVRVGDTDIASFTLTRVPDSEKSLLFGTLGLQYSEYTVSSIKCELPLGIDESGKFPVTVLAPAGYTVTVDGTALGEESITECNIPWYQALYTPQTLTPYLGVRYTYHSSTKTPELHAVTFGGEEIQPTFNEETGEYVFPILYNDTFKAMYEATVLEAAQLHARYLTGDATLTRLLPYIDQTSALNESLRNTPIETPPTHYGCDISDISADEYLYWTPEIFSCRVRMTQTLHVYGSDDIVQTVDRTYFFRAEQNNVYIFDSCNMN